MLDEAGRGRGAQLRIQPTSHAEVIEYLLDSVGEEMSFEVARTRPLLTPDLFAYLRDKLSEISLVDSDLRAQCPSSPPAGILRAGRQVSTGKVVKLWHGMTPQGRTTSMQKICVNFPFQS